MRITKTLITVLALALFVATGCDSGGDDDDTEVTIAGQYEAETLEADTGGGVSLDLLSQGGELDATLREDMTTSGRLFIPEDLARLLSDTSDVGDVDITFDGTYAVSGSGNTVTFDVEPEGDFGDVDTSFIQNVAWTFEDGRLRTTVNASDTVALMIVLRQV